jgi:hypothetical protein
MFNHRTTQPLAAQLREINPALTIRQSHVLAMQIEHLERLFADYRESMQEQLEGGEGL